ncbi:glycosyltransferase [Mobilicoccus pelagius]|uniref:glycosyltransferase n=1 Tax=Mobilicoccus pelagius TaxID=746032 RepID=UPI00058C858C|nr:glycosyltransferase [Mobilicoccus pelagius]
MLDACLIVKNEEAALPACLDSLRALGEFVHAIHVYDTGSTDDTVRIARDAGCRVVEGYWEGDFSRARNESLAMSDAEWVLIIDADERVIADPRAVGRILRSRDDVDVYNASLTHVDEHDQPIGTSSYGAVLRRERVTYQGRIHEVAARRDGSPTRTADLAERELTFLHSGYATPQIRAQKAERNARVAREELTEALAGGDAERIAEAKYHLARSVLRTTPQDAESMQLLQQSFQEFPPGAVGRDRALAVLVPELLASGDADAATSLVGAHLRGGGSAVHGRFLVARIAAARSDWPAVLRALEPLPDEGDPEHEVDPRRVLDLRMEALDALGRPDEALVCSLLLIARWGEVAWVPDLLARVAGQEAVVVAELLRSAHGPDVEAAVVRARLRAEGDYGEQVAALL